jgi:hypothetical protein
MKRDEEKLKSHQFNLHSGNITYTPNGPPKEPVAINYPIVNAKGITTFATKL